MHIAMDVAVLGARKIRKTGSVCGDSQTVIDCLIPAFGNFGLLPAITSDQENNQLTYAELDDLSNRLACVLQGKGIVVGDRIGICLDRSSATIIALVGVLKAGAVAVPLDPSYPFARLEVMRKTARLRNVISHDRHTHLFPDLSEQIVIWERFIIDRESFAPKVAEVQVSAEDPAYIVFTSGSTGNPKGVVVPHRTLVNLIEWQLNRTTFRPNARVVQFTSISFDVSLQEILTTLVSGGNLHVLTTDQVKDPRALLKYIDIHKIERLFVPYVAMRGLVEAADVLSIFPKSLKEVITAGEQLRVDHLTRRFFTELGAASLDNQYGPSESHVITAHLLQDDPKTWPELPPIGTPIINNHVYVVDENMKLLPTGEIGELCLAGKNIALGYLDNEELTRESFVDDIFSGVPSSRLYKTGDLASCSEDGCISLHGRIDHQIKIRGHRVEPGEINSIAERYCGIAQAFSHVHSSANRSEPAMALFYTVYENETVGKNDLKEFLSSQLPEYMIPRYLVEIDRIPYTPSGKVDLNALSETIGESNALQRTDDRKNLSVEQAGLMSIWSEVLELDFVPLDVDFFSLGGNSLSAVSVFLKIQQEFGLDLPLASLARASTIVEMAELIQHEKNSNKKITKDLRSLQLIRRGLDAAPAIYFVHGGAGNVLIFNELANRLARDHSVYAFQWPGWDGYSAPESLRDLASFYFNEMKSVGLPAACYLGGHCIGGLIVIELARLLRENGVRILGPLFVTDSPNIKSMSYSKFDPDFLPNDRQSFQDAWEQLNSLRFDKSRDWNKQSLYVLPPDSFIKKNLRKSTLVRHLVKCAKAVPATIKNSLNRAKMRRFLKHGNQVEIADREEFAISVMIRAFLSHDPSSYPGDVLYFKSEIILGRDIGIGGWWSDPNLGFSELVEGEFHSVVVGRGHNEIVSDPEVANHINKYVLSY